MLSSNDSIKIRMKFAAAFLLPVVLAICVRLYFVQVRAHDEMFAKARKKYTSFAKTSGKRGEIYDTSGNLLGANAPCETITADPSLIRDDIQRRRISAILSIKLKLPFGEIYRKLAPKQPMRDSNGQILRNPDGSVRMRTSRYAVIARNVSPALADDIRRNMKMHRIKAIFFAEDYMRYYPKGRFLANVLGFTSGIDGNTVAVLGLERFFNKQMSGTAGGKRYERDRAGRPLEYGEMDAIQSRDGADIYLTIDEPVQAIVEEELDAAFEEWQPKAIYAVVADPKTGNILAIAQRPTFDPNDRRNITPDEWRTRIVEDAMEPGSIMKPFSVAVAVDEGVVTPDTRFDCEKGMWMYLGKPLRDSHPYGIMSVADIIKTSSNIGTAKIALQLGPERTYQAIRRFGFGSKSGLPLKPESTGIVPRVKDWDGLSITRFPIGYAIMVSPVQMVRAYCALANNGRLPRLRLVDRVSDPETGKVHQLPVEPPVQVFKNPDTCRKMVDMLVRVTGEGGTARRASIPGFQVAGKTGTSRKFIPGQGYVAKYFGSFVGFVPAHDPALVMLVTMDEPKKSGYGGVVSAPVFRRIAERVLRYMLITPDPSLMTESERRKYEKENPGVQLRLPDTSVRINTHP